jgi:hypothetical protein
MGMIFEDLEDHEGYPARRLPDGTLTPTRTRGTAAIDAYIGACTRGWYASDHHPPTEARRGAAEDQSQLAHARPLPPAAVPARITELVDNLREEVARLADDRPLAARTVAQCLSAWSNHILQVTKIAERQRHLDTVGRAGPEHGQLL